MAKPCFAWTAAIHASFRAFGFSIAHPRCGVSWVPAFAGMTLMKVASRGTEGRTPSPKYRKQPSLSREVSKGFRQLQRSLNKLF